MSGAERLRVLLVGVLALGVMGGVVFVALRGLLHGGHETGTQEDDGPSPNHPRIVISSQ